MFPSRSAACGASPAETTTGPKIRERNPTTIASTNVRDGQKSAFRLVSSEFRSRRRTQAYRRIAHKAGKIWREFGALEYREGVGDDLNVKNMKATFPRQMKPKKG